MLYHLISAEDWSRVNDSSYAPKSLESEGFIHLSTQDQYQQTYQRYYQGQEMLVLEIDEDKLSHEVKYETNPHGKFPHLYGPLNLDAVISVTKIKPS